MAPEIGIIEAPDDVVNSSLKLAFLPISQSELGAKNPTIYVFGDSNIIVFIIILYSHVGKIILFDIFKLCC